MKAKDFRRIALGFSGAVEKEHMGHPDFRAGGRIFATLRGDDRHAMVALTPAQQADLIQEAPQIYAPEAGAWGRQGATRVTLAAAEAESVGAALTLAWKNAEQALAAKKSRPRKRAKRR